MQQSVQNVKEGDNITSQYYVTTTSLWMVQMLFRNAEKISKMTRGLGVLARDENVEKVKEIVVC